MIIIFYKETLHRDEGDVVGRYQKIHCPLKSTPLGLFSVYQYQQIWICGPRVLYKVVQFLQYNSIRNQNLVSNIDCNKSYNSSVSQSVSQSVSLQKDFLKSLILSFFRVTN